MSVNPPEGTLTIENSHLDVKGNVSAVALKLGTLRLTPSYGLDAVANVSNSTTHTLELSNATTGLVTTANVVVGKDLAVSGNATMSSNLTVSGNATVSSNLTVSGNATVTGDLNVSGALGILDAIYPVGTIIDRATAITDTHLNGKYKAFLAAPEQEWEVVPPESTVGFRAHYVNSVGHTFGANQRITSLTEIFDLGSNFSNGLFTAPSDGLYHFGINFHDTNDQQVILCLRVNGVNNSDLHEVENYGYNNHKPEQGAGVIVNLTANDTVDLTDRAGVGFPAIDLNSSIYNGLKFWGYKVGSGGVTSPYVYQRTA